MNDFESPQRVPASKTKRKRWHPGFIFAGLAFIGITFGTWVAGWWDAIDGRVFTALNPGLAAPGPWQSFWAIANWRGFDLMSAAVIGCLLIGWLRSIRRPLQKLGLARIIAFTFILISVREAQDQVADHTGYYRISPSWSVPGAVKLRECVHWIKTKDGSARSFPGDHSFVLFAVIGFLWIAGGKRRGLRASGMLIPFSIPRIVVGAHWFTDVAVGGLDMAILTLLIAYSTPAAARLAIILLRRTPRLIDFGMRRMRATRLLS